MNAHELEPPAGRPPAVPGPPPTRTEALLERLVVAVERLVDQVEHIDETSSRAAALDAWAKGQGRHPDD